MQMVAPHRIIPSSCERHPQRCHLCATEAHTRAPALHRGALSMWQLGHTYAKQRAGDECTGRCYTRTRQGVAPHAAVNVSCCYTVVSLCCPGRVLVSEICSIDSESSLYSWMILCMLLLNLRMRSTLRARLSGLRSSWLLLISVMSNLLVSKRSCTALNLSLAKVRTSTPAVSASEMDPASICQRFVLGSTHEKAGTSFE